MVKWRSSIAQGGGGALLLYFIYGTLLLFFLMAIIHDRTDLELKLRLDSRSEKTIMVWINHGYFKHGGLRFLKPAEKGVSDNIHGSSNMIGLQIGHILQRVNIYFGGEFSHRLLVFSNQITPLISSVLLGFLAMRLTLNMNIPYMQTFLLGACVVTIHQTLPLNLGLVWGLYKQAAIALFAILFLVIEEHYFRKGASLLTTFSRGSVVFFMAGCDVSGAVFFLATYYMFLVLSMPCQFKLYGIFKNVLLPALGGFGLLLTQLFWVRYSFPNISFSSSNPLIRTGFDGGTKYYFNHSDLFSDKWLHNLPGSNPLFFCGFLALVGVVAFIQKKKLYFSQQLILLSGLGCFLCFAFLFSQNVIIHSYSFQLYLAWPLILALFALLPAWLEVFSLYSGVFVFISCVFTFFVSGSQLLAYWLSMPPLWYL